MRYTDLNRAAPVLRHTREGGWAGLREPGRNGLFSYSFFYDVRGPPWRERTMCEPIDLYSTEPVSTFYLVWYGDADFNIGAYQRVHSPDSSREEVFAGGHSGDPSHSCSVPFSRHYEFLEVRWGIFPPDSSDMWPEKEVSAGEDPVYRVTRQSITWQVSLTFMVLPLI